MGRYSWSTAVPLMSACRRRRGQQSMRLVLRQTPARCERVSVPITVPVVRSVECLGDFWSEWQDLNLRPPRPERGGESTWWSASGRCVGRSSCHRNMFHVAFMLRGAAELRWWSLKLLGNLLQHTQHRKPRPKSGLFALSLGSTASYFWLGN